MNKRILFAILSLVFIIGAVVIYSSFIQPSYTKIQELRAELAMNRASYERYQKSIKQLQSLSAQYQDINQLQTIIGRILPEGRDTTNLAGQLIGFAKLNRLQITGLGTKVGTVQKSENKAIQSLGTIKAQLTVQGGYNDFKTFLGQIENNLLILDVENLSMQVGKEGKTGLENSVSFTSYYQIPETAKGATGSQGVVNN